MFENDTVVLHIPEGWSRTPGVHPAINPYKGRDGSINVGSQFSPSNGSLLLHKGRYTLALAFHVTTALAAEGGRFIESLNIPWLNTEDAESCGLVMEHAQQPAGRTLLLRDLILNLADAVMRKPCRITGDFGIHQGANARKPFLNERRWFAGAFTTTTHGGLFFDNPQEGPCYAKLYLLTSSARTPADLPPVDDPVLLRTIQEAIDIVNSIRYKRCAPVPFSGF